MATNWVLAGEFAGFPLAYHWRVLPAPAPPVGLFSEFGGLEGAVAHWGGAPAVRRRLEALERSTMSIAVFLEHIPHTLGSWLADREVSAFPRVESELAEGVAFMRDRHLIHFDVHFRNVLTDGDHLYFSDFGLALSSRFELPTSEYNFHLTHRDYDHDYVMAHLVNQHVAERVRGGADRRRFVRDWADGHRSSGVAAPAAEILDRHAGTAAVMDDFHRRLCESKQARYPADEFGHIRRGAAPDA
ncbi:protein kinase [Microbispora bryophytorum]|uniref:protein kinase n=1 Tax=Microbispora bryophytorum TaxID=1460882 RepID=UPI0033FBC4B8